MKLMERLIGLRALWDGELKRFGHADETVCEWDTSTGQSLHDIKVIIQEVESLQSELAALKEETRLLRRIAAEAKSVWDKNQLPLEADQLKNLLTDRIDFDIRHKPIDLPNERNETC